MSALTVLSCGAGTSLQDFGRYGIQRFGVGPAGAMDKAALMLANSLVGNDLGVAALEFTLLGGQFRAEGVCRLALAGADASLLIDGVAAPPLTSATVEAGQIITVTPARSGLYVMLAVQGGFDLTPHMGSLSFHKRAGLGVMVKAGDRLPLRLSNPQGPDLTLDVPHKPITGPYKVVLGPQDDYITPSGIKTFLNEAYQVSPEADRMGYRLTGPKIEHSGGYNLVSDGIVTGSIQVPGTGEPIVLLSDRQTTGGYPKIATLISSELGRFAHQRPGSAVRFSAMSRDEAISFARDSARAFHALITSIRPISSSLDSERLLSLQLIGGVVADTEFE